MTRRDRNAQGTEFFYPDGDPSGSVYTCVSPVLWPGAVKIIAGNPPVMELSRAEGFAQTILDAVEFARGQGSGAGDEPQPFRVKANHEVYHVAHPLNPDVSLCGIRFDDSWGVRLSARQAMTHTRLWGCTHCRRLTDLLAGEYDLPKWPGSKAVLEEAAKQLTWEAFTATMWQALLTTGERDNYLATPPTERRKWKTRAGLTTNHSQGQSPARRKMAKASRRRNRGK